MRNMRGGWGHSTGTHSTRTVVPDQSHGTFCIIFCLEVKSTVKHFNKCGQKFLYNMNTHNFNDPLRICVCIVQKVYINLNTCVCIHVYVNMWIYVLLSVIMTAYGERCWIHGPQRRKCHARTKDAVSATESLLQWSFSKMKGVEEASSEREALEGGGWVPPTPVQARHYILFCQLLRTDKRIPQGYEILPGFFPTTYILR